MTGLGQHATFPALSRMSAVGGKADVISPKADMGTQTALARPSALRQSSAPLTAQDLARHVMAERGLNTADKRLVRTIGKRVGSSMWHLRNQGLVRSDKGPGPCLIWEFVS